MTVAGRTHHPVWRSEACLPCGACRKACPAWVEPALRGEPGSLRGRVATAYGFPPGDGPLASPPCTATCPLHQDVAGYVSAVASGDLDRARAIILMTNPLPGVLARLCNRSCTRTCVRAAIDEAVDIRGLKAVPFEADPAALRPARRRGGDEVAIVGSGPAGLAAAATLARAGMATLVLERDHEPGGLLRFAVPDFDLPARVLDADIARILAMGVALETGTAVDPSRDLDALRSSGVRAVILATGARLATRPRRLPALAGIEDVVAFTTGARSGRIRRLSGPAFVEGEGAPALAAARTAVRLGARPVSIVAPRSQAMLAWDRETLGRALSEGVTVIEGSEVVSVSGAGSLDAVRIAASGTGRGRSRPASLLVLARFRSPDLAPILALPGTGASPAGTLLVDRDSMRAAPALYAAGEVATGARNAVEAVASGIRAARAVIRDLGGER